MPTVDLNTGLEILEGPECWALLASEEVGRVAVSWADEPEIFPVNYAVYGDNIVFGTDPGTKLSGMMRGAVVVFEVDHLDRTNREGWSVIIHGRAHPVPSDDRATLAVSSWPPRTRQQLIRITPTTITGRRIEGHR